MIYNCHEFPLAELDIGRVGAPVLIALRGGDRNEETPATENKRGMLMRRACAHALSPRSFFLLAARELPAVGA